MKCKMHDISIDSNDIKTLENILLNADELFEKKHLEDQNTVGAKKNQYLKEFSLIEYLLVSLENIKKEIKDAA